MTVLLVLVFFVALITTDYLVTRHRLAREARALAHGAASRARARLGGRLPAARGALLPPRAHLGPPARRGHGPRRRRRLRAPADRLRGHGRDPVARRVAAPGRPGVRHEGRRPRGRARLPDRGRGGRRQSRPGREARARRRRPVRPRLGAQAEGPAARRRTSATCSRAASPASGWRTAARPSSCGSWPSRAPCCRTAASPPPTSATTSRRRTGSGWPTSSCSPRPGPHRRSTMAFLPNPKARALLFDVTRCIGCHACAKACKESHGFPGDGEETELDATTYTVVLDKGDDRYLRRMCMHCADPSCASACPVGAFTKTELGPVVYDGSKCLGCRYCMVACPFSVPRYEWSKPVPVVRKCDGCFERQKQGTADRLHRGLPGRGDGGRHARGAAGRGQAAHRRESRRLLPRDLRRARGRRHERPRPVPGPLRAARDEDRPRHASRCRTSPGRRCRRSPRSSAIGCVGLSAIYWITHRREEVAAAERDEKE